MENNYEKLFSQLETPQAPIGLLEKILNRLTRERKLSAKRRLFVFSFSLLASLIALIPAWQFVWSGFAQSGFFQFFSLLFSDAAIVLTYWQNYALSLLETFPVSRLIIFLAITFIFLESLKLLAENIKIYGHQQILSNKNI